MDTIIDTASYIIKKYREITGENLDKMKLHKLLYFTQREAFAITGQPAFEGILEGWKYGPVSPEVNKNSNIMLYMCISLLILSGAFILYRFFFHVI